MKVNRIATIQMRMTPGEKEIAERMARRDRMTVSEWVRQAIRERAKRVGLWPPAEVK